MPRYPNLWFDVHPKLALNYSRAVDVVTGALRAVMGLVENRGTLANAEGCDFEAVIEHLQPWRGDDPRLQHAHAFHIRYYYTALENAGAHRVDHRGTRYWRVAASAHYEVEHTNPNHADVESCPICGPTGEYAAEQGNLVERVHDPLGLELAVRGTIRARMVRHYTGQVVRGIAAFSRLRPQVAVFSPADSTMNTQKIAVIRLRPR